MTLENSNKQTYEKKVRILGEVPCGAEFSHCKFIKDAYQAKERTLPKLARLLWSFRDVPANSRINCRTWMWKRWKPKRRTYKEREQEYQDLSTEATNLDLLVAKTNNKIHLLINEIDGIKTRIEVYELNKDAIENREELIQEEDELKKFSRSAGKRLSHLRSQNLRPRETARGH